MAIVIDAGDGRGDTIGGLGGINPYFFRPDEDESIVGIALRVVM